MRENIVSAEMHLRLFYQYHLINLIISLYQYSSLVNLELNVRSSLTRSNNID